MLWPPHPQAKAQGEQHKTELKAAKREAEELQKKVGQHHGRFFPTSGPAVVLLVVLLGCARACTAGRQAAHHRHWYPLLLSQCTAGRVGCAAVVECVRRSRAASGASCSCSAACWPAGVLFLLLIRCCAVLCLQVTGCERRIVQMQHEMKRKEREFERLQEK